MSHKIDQNKRKPLGRVEHHECGCVSDDLRWLEMCDAHWHESQETHQRANEERGRSPALAEEV